MDELDEQMRRWELARSRHAKRLIGYLLVLPLALLAVGWFVVDALEHGAPGLFPSIVALVAVAFVP